ncbi:hypothetical protein L3X38_004270 [Prunus dulcis]|uniref:Uncharacterized protein n=1 Tax=Prunus dulcis TaxID=3755 RepID=A0AAD5F312_PRUDU|nr:hypothetical protein L3X38_004270 [Prunus dulcis]
MQLEDLGAWQPGYIQMWLRTKSRRLWKLETRPDATGLFRPTPKLGLERWDRIYWSFAARFAEALHPDGVENRDAVGMVAPWGFSQLELWGFLG